MAVTRRVAGRTRVLNTGFEGDTLSGIWRTREMDYGASRSDPSCAKLWDGKLVLHVKEGPDKLLTGHVWTPNMSFTYGWFEVRMKFSSTEGHHACFWLNSDYLTPEHTEIDVNENFGNNVVHHNIYWKKEGQTWDDFHNGSGPGAVKSSSSVAATEWRDYALDWRPDRLDFYIGVNGQFDKVFSTTQGLSNKPHYLVLSNLVKDWELPRLDRSRLGDAKVFVESVQVWQ